MAAVRHLRFLKLHFYSRNGQESQNASLCQIWSKSLKRQPRYGDFSIFQDGGRRHLVFLKFQIFNGGDGQQGRTTLPRQISSKWVQPRLKYGDFSISQDGGRRHLGFSKFQIFNGGDGQEGRTMSPHKIVQSSNVIYKNSKQKR